MSINRFYLYLVRTTACLACLLWQGLAFADFKQLDKAIQQIVADFDGTLGLYAENLQTGETIGFNQDKVFPMASTRKIPIMLEAFIQQDKGKLDLNKKRKRLSDPRYHSGSGLLKHLSSDTELSLIDYIWLMITISDNISADIVASEYKFSDLNASLKKLGVSKMTVDRSSVEMLDDLHSQGEAQFYSSYKDSSTPKAMATLLKKIANGQAASKGACDTMMKIMGYQKFNSGLPRYLRHVQIAHKTGSTNKATNDVGIMTLPDGQKIVISVYTLRDVRKTPRFVVNDVIGRIAKTVVEAAQA